MTPEFKDNRTALEPCRKLTEYATNVLLVDDQVIVGEAVRRLLATEDDIALHFCSDPFAAMSMADEVVPTVILQDLVMPGIDGLDLLRMFRSNQSTMETPIVVLSSKEDARVKSDSFAAGASDYLVKLPDRVELIARIRYHSRAYINQRKRTEMAKALLQSEYDLQGRIEELQSTLDELSRTRSELEKANARLEHESFVDTLTQVLNRRGLEHQLVVESGRATRDEVPLYAVLIDCDNFKRINDGLGHDAGDRVLQEIASRVSTSTRRTDHVSRVGGDEFLVLLSQVSRDDAAMLAERIRSSVADAPITIAGQAHNQTISVAVFEVPQSAKSTTDILATATAVLRCSKVRKNCVELEWGSP